MRIDILRFAEGAKQARGLVVVIDVFRAFSTACYVMAGGAERIVPVGDLELAYRLKRLLPDAVLIGERGGVRQPGFDYGNSPTRVRDVRFDGKTVIQTTSAGTQGIANARDADEIVTGSFVNAGAVVRYILSRRPERVSLVCMGFAAREPAEEDELCAEYIRNALLGRPNDFAAIVARLRGESGTNRFLDAEGDPDADNPRSDFDLCLALDRFPFVLRAEPWTPPEGVGTASDWGGSKAEPGGADGSSGTFAEKRLVCLRKQVVA